MSARHTNEPNATSDAGIEKPVAPASRESQEHHVAGHVGDEDMTEQQVAERVHEARDQCQPEQQRRERPMSTGPARDDHVSYVVDEAA